MANRILSVACQRCGARVSESCKRPSGSTSYSFHLIRRQDYQKKLDKQREMRRMQKKGN